MIDGALTVAVSKRVPEVVEGVLARMVTVTDPPTRMTGRVAVTVPLSREQLPPEAPHVKNVMPVGNVSVRTAEDTATDPTFSTVIVRTNPVPGVIEPSALVGDGTMAETAKAASMHSWTSLVSRRN